MDQPVLKKRLVVGQYVFSTIHRRTAQLMGISNDVGACTVRFHDDCTVVVIDQSMLEIASWDQIRASGPKARTVRATRHQG